MIIWSEHQFLGVHISKKILRKLLSRYDINSSADIGSIVRCLLITKNTCYVLFLNILYLFTHFSQKSNGRSAERLVFQI